MLKSANLLQSPLVIVDLLIVDSLVIVDRVSRQNVYFSMYFSRNSGFSGYSGQFAADGIFYLIKAGQIEEKRAF